VPHGTDEAEDRHSNFYDAWVNLAVSPQALGVTMQHRIASIVARAATVGTVKPW